MNWSFNFIFIKFTPWRLYIIVIAFVNLTNTIASFFLPETPKFLLAMNESKEAIQVLQMMYRINTKNSKEVRTFQYLNEFFYEKFNLQSYPVQNLIHEGSGNNLAATKGFVNFIKLVWNQTKPIFVPPHLDSTVKLCFMVFTLFAIGHGTVTVLYYLSYVFVNIHSLFLFTGSLVARFFDSTPK